MSEKTFEEAAKAITQGDAAKAAELAKRGLDEGIEPMTLLDQGFVPGINEVGDLFSKGKLFIPMLIKSASAMVDNNDHGNPAWPPPQTVDGPAGLTFKLSTAKFYTRDDIAGGNKLVEVDFDGSAYYTAISCGIQNSSGLGTGEDDEVYGLTPADNSLIWYDFGNMKQELLTERPTVTGGWALSGATTPRMS